MDPSPITWKKSRILDRARGRSLLLVSIVLLTALGQFAQGAAFTRDDLPADPEAPGVDPGGELPPLEEIPNPIDAVWTNESSNATQTVLEVSPFKFWTNLNDGAGSGLDADLIDGLDADAFFAAVGQESLLRGIDIGKLRDELKDHLSDNLELVNGSIDSLDGRLTGEIGTVRTDLTGKIVENATKLLGLEGTTQAHDSQLVTARWTFNASNATTALVRSDLNRTTFDLANQTSKVTGLESRVGALEGTTAQLTTNVDALNTSVGFIRGQTNGLITFQAEQTIKHNILEGRVGNLELDVPVIRGDILVLESKLADKASSARVDTVEGTANSALTEVGLLRTDVEDEIRVIEGRLAPLESDITGLGTRTTGLESWKENAQRSITKNIDNHLDLNNTVKGFATAATFGGGVHLSQNSATMGTLVATTGNFVSALTAHAATITTTLGVGSLTTLTDGVVGLGTNVLLDTSQLKIGTAVLTNGALSIAGNVLNAAGLARGSGQTETRLEDGTLQLGDLSQSGAGAVRMGHLGSMNEGSGVGVLVGTGTRITDGEVETSSLKLTRADLQDCERVAMVAGALSCRKFHSTFTIEGDEVKLAQGSVTNDHIASGLSWSKLTRDFPAACPIGSAVQALIPGGTTCTPVGSVDQLTVERDSTLCNSDAPGCKVQFGSHAALDKDADDWTRITTNVAGKGLRVGGQGQNLKVDGAITTGGTISGGSSISAGTNIVAGGGITADGMIRTNGNVRSGPLVAGTNNPKFTEISAANGLQFWHYAVSGWEIANRGPLVITDISNNPIDKAFELTKDYLHINGTFVSSLGWQTGDAAEPTVALDAGPGDVVVMDGFTPEGKLKVRAATQARDTTVVGVISTSPTVRLAGLPTDTPLAVAGVVPVKVVGPVARGALLTSSTTPGHAMACPEDVDCRGAIIGKALEAFEGAGLGSVRVMVTIG